MRVKIAELATWPKLRFGNRFTKRCFMVSISTGIKSSGTTLWIIMSMKIMKKRNKDAYITTPPFGHPF